jgi:hypothetical protein
MMQHMRDSPRHPRQNADLPLTPNGRPTCSCGVAFGTEQALQQHKRDFPLHTETDTAASTGKMKCSCGKVVKGEAGMKSHLQHSPRHDKPSSVDDGKQPAYQGDGGGVSPQNVVSWLRWPASEYALTLYRPVNLVIDPETRRACGRSPSLSSRQAPSPQVPGRGTTIPRLGERLETIEYGQIPGYATQMLAMTTLCVTRIADGVDTVQMVCCDIAGG